MAHEHERRLRSPSPAGSGRDSPAATFRGPRQQLEDESAKHDKPYRRWATQVERALTLFEAARLEWPDYISALGRLLKAIQAHPPDVDSVPHRHSVANKLAQCLDPSLPSGVHQKALELYDYIFTILRRDGLSRDLSVYLPGLSPVLSFASLSIRPMFLTLLEKHITLLDALALRPALRAILLCLLPGLEEENSEDFDRTLKIVDDIRDSVNANPSRTKDHLDGFGDEYFWQCLFLAAVSGVSRRQGTLAYLVRRLPKLARSPPSSSKLATNGESRVTGEDEEDLSLPQAAEAVISPEPGLLIRCFVAGLEDEQPLLQRGFMDLLLSHLPLHSSVLVNRVGDQDLEKLVSAATTVVSRRDMSLNRRLWSWFLGPGRPDDDGDVTSPLTPMLADRKNNKNVEYFKRYGVRPLSNSIIHMLQQKRSSAAALMKPYRICLSLLDRWELGNALVPMVFSPAFEGLLAYRNGAAPSDYQEVFRSANAFFDGIESGLIWAQIVALVRSSLEGTALPRSLQLSQLKLASFVVQSFNIRDEEMLAFHIPLTSVLTLACVANRASDRSSNDPNADEGITKLAVDFAEKLIERMPERNQLNSSFGQNDQEQTQGDSNQSQKRIVALISAFYTSSGGDVSSCPPPLSSQQIAVALLHTSSGMLLQASAEHESDSDIVARAQLLANLISKTPNCQGIDISRLCECLTTTLAKEHNETDDFLFASCAARILVQAIHKLSSKEKRLVKSSGVIPILVARFWSYLSPGRPKFHVESVRMLWLLDTADQGDGVLESSVSRYVSHHAHTRDLSDEAESARQFALLWSHSMNLSAGAQKRGSTAKRSSITAITQQAVESRDHQAILVRPLLLVLQGLDALESELSFFLISWLKSSNVLFTVFDVLITRLVSLELQQRRKAAPVATDSDHRMKLLHSDRTKECCYYLRIVFNLVRLPLDNIEVVLAAQGTSTDNTAGASDETLAASIIALCLNMVELGFVDQARSRLSSCAEMQCLALSVIQQIFKSSHHIGISTNNIEGSLLDMLDKGTHVKGTASSVQVALLDTTTSYLRSRFKNQPGNTPQQRKISSTGTPPLGALRRSSADRDEGNHVTEQSTPPPAQLLRTLQKGMTSNNSRNVLENWVGFTIDVLPLYAQSLFQNLIPLVETFCKQIDTNFDRLKQSFVLGGCNTIVMPENSLISLLNGLENTLAIAHDQLALEESSNTNIKSPEPTQGFFGNVVSGVFSTETTKSRQALANSRLTVILCLKDAVRICFSIWSWAAYGENDNEFDMTSAASFSYSSSRLRNRARRLLDRLFIAETLECLETLVGPRSLGIDGKSRAFDSAKVITLLQALDGSRPKRLIPAIFNALYSRTNPSALEPTRMSSMTSDVTDTDLGVFLVDYTKSLDDDAMDEIWMDCMTFLKDVLSNPLVHSSILPCLLLFLLTLAEKVEKTNFGEQRKMRKELSDLFQRLLQATFTSRPAGILHDPGDGTGIAQGLSVIDILTSIIPKLHIILPESDKQLSAVTQISTNAFGSLIHAKQFPENVTPAHFTLLQRVVRVSTAAKVWRRDVAEIYQHPKVLSIDSTLARSGLLPILRQWGLVEKDRFSDTLNRIPAPTAAGIMFGVGANAARLEADKKSQLNLRRATLLALALDTDALVPHVAVILEKVTDLFGASATSSPSSATRAEVFMLIQTVVLKTSSVHLSPFWPTVTRELQKAITSALADGRDGETYNAFSLLQACKLLDLLLLVGPDDFQMHAWLFVTDTIDAVYRPTGSDHAPVALVDEVSQGLNEDAPLTPGAGLATPTAFDLARGKSGYELEGSAEADKKSGLLLEVSGESIVGMSREDVVGKKLRPWFTQLSLQCFEREYSMQDINWDSCRAGLLDELFDEKTMVG